MEPKELFRKKFIFGLAALVVVTVVTVCLKYPGEIYVQLVGIVATGYFTSQAYVDGKTKEE